MRAWLWRALWAASMTSCAPHSEPATPGASTALPFAPGPRVRATEPVAYQPNATEAAPSSAPAQDLDAEKAGFQTLDVPGFLSAVMLVPHSAAKLPLFVATHGAGGSPEEHCRFWQPILKDAFVLLCLRGAEIRRNAPWGFYYPNHRVLERELVAALAALRERLGSRLSESGAVYAGYSQGASMGALMIVEHAQLFERLIMIEGGFSEWSAASARKFVSNGGKKVLFACGGSHCANKANVSAGLLNKAGAETRVEHAPGAGHTYADEVGERVRAQLPWLFGAKVASAD